jgi:papilin
VQFCELEMAPGNCSQKQNYKWFYDKNLRYCRQFHFSGCNGNENKFETRQQCVQICEKPKRKEICNSNKVYGPCSENIKRWYLDIETHLCEEFTYSGCLGNDNNFESKDECQNYCWEYLSHNLEGVQYQTQKKSEIKQTIVIKDNDTSKINICNLRKDEGEHCDNNGKQLERWYFNPSMFVCLQLDFKGCGGNDNNFLTKENCEKECNTVLTGSSLEIEEKSGK